LDIKIIKGILVLFFWYLHEKNGFEAEVLFFFQTHVRKSCNVRGVEQEMRGKLQNTPGFDHQEWASMRPKMGFSFNKNHQPKLDIKKCSFPAP
jgi:hypothetical protein